VTSIATRLSQATGRVTAMLGDHEVVAAVGGLDDRALLDGLAAVADARRALDVAGAALSGEIERRSRRDLGYDGLAQRAGHRTATNLIQSVTGQSAADVRKATGVGQDLAAVAVFPVPNGEPVSPAKRETWFAPLAVALAGGVLSREQYDAIRRGLGEPPVERYSDAEVVTAAWREAAAILIEEASDQLVEDLRASARLARDTLDPIGTQLRFDERFERRSFTMWVDESGQQCARIRWDDDAAAWVRTILNAALRPRRGPRFVGADSAASQESSHDTRSNEQLQYDTLLAVLKTGAQADPTQAFGDRQPGVRIVVTAESLERRTDASASMPVGFFEETGQAIPGGVVEAYLCNAGTTPVTLDSFGNPLDVGRERRLFTKRQRIAMAIRDGGCLDCGAEPSRCEAHHIDHWHEHHGRTDLADGVLLCCACHMRLHSQRRRITRVGSTYYLHPPAGERGEPRILRPRSLLRFEKRLEQARSH